jgi:hypothetical protein
MQRDENLRREMIRKKQTSSDRGYDEKEDEEKGAKNHFIYSFRKAYAHLYVSWPSQICIVGRLIGKEKSTSIKMKKRMCNAWRSKNGGTGYCEMVKVTWAENASSRVQPNNDNSHKEAEKEKASFINIKTES